LRRLPFGTYCMREASCEAGKDSTRGAIRSSATRYGTEALTEFETERGLIRILMPTTKCNEMIAR
jgi:hypothetical protein